MQEGLMMASAGANELTVNSETIESLAKRAEDGEQIYAMVDGCDEPRVPIMVAKIGNERAASLYSGRAAIEYASIAPYIVKLDGEWIRWIGSELVGTPWGFFFIIDTSHDFAAIRRHWKRFLKVEVPDGRKLYFRFYDPRVLETFLEASTATELEQFFGPIEEIFLLRSSAEANVYRRSDSAFKRNP
jgi:hypothetical protein